MEIKKFNALIIDDHPLISEAYKSAFGFVESQNDYKFQIQVADNCDTAQTIIEDFSDANDNIDIIFLDISLPPSNDGKILSGEDLGLLINEKLPEAKIIVSTTFNDNYRVHSILKNVNPDGFLVKNDITPIELVSAIQEVIIDPPYYSKTVTKMMRNQVSHDYFLDDLDRKILYELSIGNRVNKLPLILPLSLAAIQKRKRQMAKIFDIDNSDDRNLILAAKEKGFL
ncbi:transcriptional regulator [Tenacibaculum holothuriorum]|uniref:Transcriptional regulator n=1 Tax=Tenacibaculum holothuriorum TaxID=1635173 RepID=A0A1Y2PDX7_9FLAO|nr:response regulator [Tenacibaculum holothuriorum]OSY88201.1 transcriptional regulator [Tenacibaculum holothuriorum]